MPEDLFAFNKQQMVRLKRMLDAYEAGNFAQRPQQPNSQVVPQRVNVEFGKADASISGTTVAGGPPGSGTVSFYTFTSTGGTTDTGEDGTAYNFSSVAVSTGQWLHFKRHYRTGKWLIDFESCT